MTDIKNEVQSIRDYVGPALAGVKFHLQSMPTKYAANELSIRFAGSSTESETGFHYRLDRIYQLVYFGASELDCLAKMQVLEEKFNIDQVIPLKGSERHLRLEPFSISAPFKTESNVYSIIGILNASLREARPQTAWPTVGELYTRTYTNKTAASWQVLNAGITVDFLPNGYTFSDLESGVNVLGETASPDGFTWTDIEDGKTVFTEEDE